jgi:hypothetical protein
MALIIKRGASKSQEKCIDKARNPVLGADFFRERETCGVVAQLGERLNGIQEAASSILASSTRKIKGSAKKVDPFYFFVLPHSYHFPTKNSLFAFNFSFTAT